MALYNLTAELVVFPHNIAFNLKGVLKKVYLFISERLCLARLEFSVLNNFDFDCVAGHC